MSFPGMPTIIYDVICDGCGQSFHETRPGYDPKQPAKGYNFRMKQPWRGYGWSSFPENEDSVYGALECPGCGTLYGNGSGFPKIKARETVAIVPNEIFQAAHVTGEIKRKGGRPRKGEVYG